MKRGQKNQIVIVTGMNGAGKDYLAERAFNHPALSVIGWGDMLSEELGLHKDVMMRMALPDAIQEGQWAVCNKILSIQPVVALCHVIKLEGGRYRYNYEIEKRLNPLCYVFITAPPALIAERIRVRNKEQNRHNEEMTVADIARIQDVKLKLVQKLATLQQSDCIVLHNTEALLASNIQALRQISQALTKKVQS